MLPLFLQMKIIHQEIVFVIFYQNSFFFIIKYYCNNYICIVQMQLLLVTAFLIHMKQKCIFVYRQQVSYNFFLQRTLQIYICNLFFNIIFLLSVSLAFDLYSIFHLRAACEASARRRSNTTERNNYSIKIKVYRSFEKRTRMS